MKKLIDIDEDLHNDMRSTALKNHVRLSIWYEMAIMLFLDHTTKTEKRILKIIKDRLGKEIRRK